MEIFSLNNHHQQAVSCWQVADREQNLSMACRWLLEMETQEGLIFYTILAVTLGKLNSTRWTEWTVVNQPSCVTVFVQEIFPVTLDENEPGKDVWEDSSTHESLIMSVTACFSRWRVTASQHLLLVWYLVRRGGFEAELHASSQISLYWEVIFYIPCFPMLYIPAFHNSLCISAALSERRLWSDVDPTQSTLPARSVGLPGKE